MAQYSCCAFVWLPSCFDTCEDYVYVTPAMAHGPTTWCLSLATTNDERWMVDKKMHKNMAPSDSVAYRGNIVHGCMQPCFMLPRTYLELAFSASHIYPHPCNTAVRAYIKCRNASQNNAATKSNPRKGACPTCLRCEGLGHIQP